MSHHRRVVDSWCPTHAMTIHAVGEDGRRRCIICLGEVTAEIRSDAVIHSPVVAKHGKKKRR